jgi:hypothetical protein
MGAGGRRSYRTHTDALDFCFLLQNYQFCMSLRAHGLISQSGSGKKSRSGSQACFRRQIRNGSGRASPPKSLWTDRRIALSRNVTCGKNFSFT